MKLRSLPVLLLKVSFILFPTGKTSFFIQMKSPPCLSLPRPTLSPGPSQPSCFFWVPVSLRSLCSLLIYKRGFCVICRGGFRGPKWGNFISCIFISDASQRCWGQRCKVLNKRQFDVRAVRSASQSFQANQQQEVFWQQQCSGNSAELFQNAVSCIQDDFSYLSGLPCGREKQPSDNGQRGYDKYTLFDSLTDNTRACFTSSLVLGKISVKSIEEEVYYSTTQKSGLEINFVKYWSIGHQILTGKKGFTGCYVASISESLFWNMQINVFR